MPSGLFNSWPLQFLRTGYYDLSYGYLHARTTDGLWWSVTAGSATYGRYLDTWTGVVYAQIINFRGAGFALRCGVLMNIFASLFISFCQITEVVGKF